MIEKYCVMQNVPVKWRLFDDAGEQTRHLQSLTREVWRVSEKYKPAVLFSKRVAAVVQDS